MKTVHDNRAGTATALIVFCVFTMSVLTVLVLGVSAYKKVMDITREGYEERLCLSYIWTKVKNGDKAEKVYITDFQGLTALSIDEVYDGITYHTVIYHYEGWVYELFYESGLEFSPGAGVTVIGVDYLSFEPTEDGLIKVSAGSENVFISPRAKSAVAFNGGGSVK